MKKNDVGESYIPIFSKTIRIMSITTFLLVCVVCCLSASTYAQDKKLTINRQNTSIIEILKELEQVSEFTFFFHDDKVNAHREASVNIQNASIEDVLTQVLKNTGYEYKIIDRQVLIKATDRLATAQQQKRNISGTVIDGYGDPIIGANIMEKGTANGTISDINGNFTLGISSGTSFVVSYIGYLTQEVNIGAASSYSIVMAEDANTLEEVVVVGYGTMKKKDLTGAISTVSGEALSARKTTQLSTALQGATAGVMVTRDNSAPGATATIRVRGITTMSSNDPLVIVDGVPGDINLVNPEDVENISVLKDAASASIYGSRAAAGVILITTKRANETSMSLTYNFEYGWEMPTNLPKYAGVQRYMEMVNELRYNDNNAGGWYQTYSEDQVSNWVKNNATDPDAYPITDWQDVLLKSSAPRQTHSITLSGGSKNVKTKASFRYDNTEGLYHNRNYERYMVRVNNDIKVNKYLQGYIDINFRRAVSLQPNTNPLDAIYRKTPPVYATQWTNGMWGDVKDGGNPLAMIMDGGTNKGVYNQISGKAGLDITPLEGLKISAIVAPVYKFDQKKKFVKAIPYTYADDPGTVKGYMSGYYTTDLTEERNNSYNITTQFYANYEKTLGSHRVTAMIGYEDYYSEWEDLGAARQQFLLDRYPYLNVGPEDYRDNSGSGSHYGYRSFFGRATYSFDSRYMIQANIRRDASSRFAEDYRWATFPSVSAGWMISEESFIKKLKWENVLSSLKLKASWGTLGNERINSNYFPYQALMDFGTAWMYNGNELSSMNTAYQAKYAVHDITWETTETWNIGLESTFFKGRLRFNADIYKKKTKDMLLALEIPSFTGFDNPDINSGHMHTKGYDIEVGWNDKIGDFRYSVSANMSDFVSEMGNLGGTEFLGEQVKMEGSEFNEWYGYLSDGLYLTQEDLDNSPKLNNNVKVGDVKYKDISGPDGVPDGIISSEYDRVCLGGSLPRYMFGLNLTAAWKGFDLAMSFQGVGKQNSRIYTSMVEGLADNWTNFPALIDGKYWSEKNTDEQNAAAKYPRLTRQNKDTNFTMSDYWLFNGRYLRMKNLTVGYTLPKNLTQKAGMDMVRLYVAGNDIFCLSSYPQGWDPEVSTTGYPITSSFMFGISVNF